MTNTTMTNTTMTNTTMTNTTMTKTSTSTSTKIASSEPRLVLVTASRRAEALGAATESDVALESTSLRVLTSTTAETTNKVALTPVQVQMPRIVTATGRAEESGASTLESANVPVPTSARKATTSDLTATLVSTNSSAPTASATAVTPRSAPMAKDAVKLTILSVSKTDDNDVGSIGVGTIVRAATK